MSEKLFDDLNTFNHLAKEIISDCNKNGISKKVKPTDLLKKFGIELNNSGISDNHLKEILKELVLHTPKTSGKLFFNQLFGGVNSKAVLGDLLAVLLNNSMATYKIAGPMIELEREILRKVAHLISYPNTFGGTMPTGGSMSNFMALVVARDKKRPKTIQDGNTDRLVFYTSENSHYSIGKNASFCGIGRDNLRYIDTNENLSLQSQIDDLTGRLEAAEERLVAAQLEFDSLLGRYETLLADFQNAVIKGTKEGIERVSLTAQVRGLGAQKETLASQLDSEKEIVKTLQETIRTNTQIAKQQIEAANQQVKAAQATASTAANSKKKKIICNELYHQGYLPQHIWDADERWGDKRFVTDPKLVIGYQMWARKVVEFMRRKPQYTPIIYFLCKPWTEWMAYDLGVLPKNNLRGQFTQWVGRYFSYMVYDLYGGDKLYQRYLNAN